MKTPPKWIWSAAAVPLALIAGILLGRTSSAPENEAEEANNIPARKIQSRNPSSNGADSANGSRSGRNSAGEENASYELTTILESTSRLDRTQRLLSFLDRLPTDQFAAVYAEMANSPMAAIRGSERSLILQAWAERDPLAAVDYLQVNEARDWERETTLSTWAAIDPQGAFAWATTAADEGEINNWVLGSMRGIASTNPELARDFLMQLDDGKTRERSLRSIEAYVMQYGFDYAEGWITGIDDPKLLGQASRRLADDLAELDPSSAARWNSAIADTDTRRDVSETVSDRWARQDLDGAKAWVESLPENTRTEAAEGVARHYARQDPQGAASWLNSLGDDPDYDGARQILVRESYRQDPETSLGFVSTISDDRERNRNYNRYLGDWMRRDAESARSWTEANQASLPPSIVKRYLR